MNEPESVDETMAADLSHQMIATFKMLLYARDRAPRIAEGLDPIAQPLLHHLERRGTCRVSELATLMHADVSTVSRQAANLARHGLIDKSADPDDRRVQVCSVSEAGREAVAMLHRQHRDWFRDVLRGWSPEDIATFRTYLARFAEDVERTVTATTTASGDPRPGDQAPHERISRGDE